MSAEKQDPESKGKVENFVKFIKSSFLFSKDIFTSFDSNTGGIK